MSSKVNSKGNALKSVHGRHRETDFVSVNKLTKFSRPLF